MNVEVPHANLAEVTRMVLVEVDPVVVLATGVTTTAGMLPVLANTTMTVGHVTTKLPGLLFAGGHGYLHLKRSSIVSSSLLPKSNDEIRTKATTIEQLLTRYS